jgi:hypothetical protein
MPSLTEIPFTLDLDRLREKAHVDEDDAADFAVLVDTARHLGRPKALYRECAISAKGEETVVIDGVTFTSRTLRRNLEPAERVFAYVATCGHEMNDVVVPPGDCLAEFWWDTIKTELLWAASNHLHAHLRQRYRLGKTATMAPGSGDVSVWPIEQQHELFALLGDVTAQIGVVLTDSCLMHPNKTISGFHFPTEHDFRSCQVCQRAVCPNRGAAFDAALWAEVQG